MLVSSLIPRCPATHRLPQDDFEDFALREFEDEYLDARDELIQDFTTRELIEELEDRLQAREEGAAADAAGATPPTPPAEGAEGAGAPGGAPPQLKKLKKHHKKKHHKKHGHPSGKYKHGKKGKWGKKGKKGKKGLKHRKPLGAGTGDLSAYQSPPLVAPPAVN
jgi:hypothetical protein